MKKYIISVLIIIIIILPNFSAAQYKLLNLSPEIRDTIDLIERNYYNLYQDIKEFQYAMIYFCDDSVTISKIYFLNENGVLVDTIISHTPNYERNLIACIRQINSDRLENFESGSKITVTKIDGKVFVGKLLAVGDSSFIICPDTISEASTLSLLKNYMKLNTNEINIVFIENDFSNRIRPETDYGALLGLIPGIIIGVNSVDEGFFSMPESEVKVWAGIAGAGCGALIGGLIGMVVGLIISPADETIHLNSASDIEQLKGYLVE
jgi:hypothetical protein